MGIANVTPDSFSDGGQFATPAEAIAHCLRMLEDGADLIDIGGESTRPGTSIDAQIPATKAVRPVSAEEELSRVLPVVEGVRKQRPDALLSIDTYKGSVAAAAVRASADIVNDVSGLGWDPEMAGTLAGLKCGVVLMHTRGRPDEWRALPGEPRIYEVVEAELRKIADRAVSSGIAQDRIVLDPGFGFGKSFGDNYPLLARFGELHELGYPLLAGASRKSFLGRTAGARFGADLPADRRLNASVSAAVIAAMQGAHIVRVHDVRATVEALAIVDAVIAEMR